MLDNKQTNKCKPKIDKAKSVGFKKNHIFTPQKPLKPAIAIEKLPI